MTAQRAADLSLQINGKYYKGVRDGFLKRRKAGSSDNSDEGGTLNMREPKSECKK